MLHNNPTRARTGAIKRIRATLLSALVSAAVFFVPAAHADVAQAPLLVSGQADPNIMFMIDDSGSMQFEYMPEDEFLGWANYVFPRLSNNVYGGSDYANRVVLPWDGNVIHPHRRSATFNKVFYNPDIDYEPWVRADGSEMPDADPENALVNPMDPSRGARDLTDEVTEEANWIWHDGGGYTANTFDWTYWPITYFHYNSNDMDDINEKFDPDNYTKVQITDATPASATFTSPGGVTRTRDEEIQNFANWHTYHRSRILTARGGIGRAFVDQLPSIRVGYGAINSNNTTVDGVLGNAVTRGVRSFRGADRVDFYERLYEQPIPAAGTPSRTGLRGAGEYYSRTDSRGPWSSTPGDNGGTDLACRTSATVLMSDGFWSQGAWFNPGVGNVDNTAGPTITGPDGQSFSYTPEDPFRDSTGDTLADVAMRYWNRDLRTDMDNQVPTTGNDPAFWQHMRTFTVGLGVEGTINTDDAFDAVESGNNINWPNPFGNNPGKIDDMLHAAVNGRGDFFSAGEPEVFAAELEKIISDLVEESIGSSASVATNSTRLDTDTLIYQARFDTRDWSGQLLAFSLNADGTFDLNNPVWDAASDGNIPVPGNRNIFTWDPDNEVGQRFRWVDLTADQQTALNNNTDLLDWIKGDQSNEDGVNYRRRNQTVLGTVVNSDPAIAGEQDFGFAELPGDEGATYRAYLNNDKATRPEVLYFGANDGMLHGVNAGSGTNGGEEMLAFVPNGVYDNLAELADPTYDHRFFVDGPPSVSDAWNSDDEEWRTVLVGTTGAGGGSVFALDVTDPENFDRQNVLWEFEDADMEFSTSQPSIVRLNTGQWVAVFGNGYGTGAHLYVVELFSGDLIEKITLDDSGDMNGLATPAPVSLDGNRRIADTVYAGDMKGNLWRVDLNDMRSEFGSGGGPGFTPDPLFEAVGPDGNAQPITTRPALTRHPDGGIMVLFGTGSFFRTEDNQIPADPGNRDVQAFYGLRDQGSEITGGLQQQEITQEGDLGGFGFELRVTTDHNAGANGWYLNLVSPVEGRQTERVVSRALVRGERVIFATMIPEEDPCGFGGESWLMEMNAVSGSRLDVTPFDLNDDGEFTGDDWVEIPDGDGGTIRVPVSGKRSEVGVIKTPGVVSAGETEYKYTSGSSGEIERHVESSGPDNGRQSWQQLR